MQRLLFDQGLPGGAAIGVALRALGLEAHVVGEPEAPPSGSPDKDNCTWCSEHKAVLVTHDRGKKDREILDMLNQHEVGAILVLNELRVAPPHRFARAILGCEGKMDEVTASRRRLHHVLRASGHLANRR